MRSDKANSGQKQGSQDPFYNLDRAINAEKTHGYAPPPRKSDPFEGLRTSIMPEAAKPQSVNWGDLEAEISTFSGSKQAAVPAAQMQSEPPFTAQNYPVSTNQPSHNKKETFDDQTPVIDHILPPPDRQPKGGAKTIAGILGLALLGALGIFGYRAVSGGSKTTEPPAIKASATPEKVVVPQPAKEANKSVMERAPNSAEKVVPRDEKPLTTSQQAEQSSGAKVITNNNDPDEPKRVRTITITSDGSGNSVVRPSVPSAIPAQMPANIDTSNVPTRAVRTQNVTPPATAPLPTTAPKPIPAQLPKPDVVAKAPVAPKVETVKIETAKVESKVQQTPAREITTTRSGNAPMSISPNAVQTAKPVQTAAVTPTITPKASASGNYVVQVGSAKTEQEARNAFKSMQGKNSALAGRSANYVEAEKDDGSTFYRVRLSPTSKEAANSLCAQIKASGGAGACFVTAN